MQARFFILWRLCQHAEPDLMPLIDALQGEAGAFRVVRAKAVRTPLQGCHVLKGSEQRMQIQGKSGDHHGTVCCPTDEFHGGGIDDEFPERLFLMVLPPHRSHGTVGFHTVHHDVNQRFHPRWRVLSHAGLLLRLIA
jgi:hypothetical protein